MKPNTKVTASPRPKPRLALAIATVFGLGYIRKAPGTFGSLAGIGLAWIPWCFFLAASAIVGGFGMDAAVGGRAVEPLVLWQIFITVFTAGIGTWAANRAASFLGKKDPQVVVIDEVSGQHLALLLGGFSPGRAANQSVLWRNHSLGFLGFISGNWKYLLVGLILFRVFDIWKPFPVRRTESLPGGWGIMADDWAAAVYAALGLWLLRWLGL